MCMRYKEDVHFVPAITCSIIYVRTYPLARDAHLWTFKLPLLFRTVRRKGAAGVSTYCTGTLKRNTTKDFSYFPISKKI